MGVEIETKIFGPYFGTEKDHGIDIKKTEKILIKYKAELVFDGTVETTSYKPSSLPSYKSFSLSKKGKECEIIIDGRYVINVDDYNEMKNILSSLGFSVKKYIREFDPRGFNGKSFRLRYYFKDDSLIKTVIGLKKKIECKNKKVKEMDEYETKVSGDYVALVKSLGFVSKRQTWKNRKSYILKDPDYGKVRFDLDHYTTPSIPPFLEIESSEEGIDYYIKRLGLENNERRPWDTQELFDHYFKR